MNLPTLTVFFFFGCIFMLSRFSKYSRRLANTWGMEPEDMERLERKAKAALRLAGLLFAMTVVGVVLVIVLPGT